MKITFLIDCTNDMPFCRLNDKKLVVDVLAILMYVSGCIQFSNGETSMET